MVPGSPAAAGLFFLLVLALAAPAAAQGDAKRGAYAAKAGGCVGCHTEERKDAVRFAGGRALKTPSARSTGRTSPRILRRASENGARPTSCARCARAAARRRALLSRVPVPSFTRINDADLKDLWAFLRSLPPDARPSREHDLGLFFRWRFVLGIWKWLFFTPGALVPDAARSAVLNRGAYLVQALGHCGECHTPRNFLGGPKTSRTLAGAKLPDGANASNLTPTRLKKVGDDELKDLLRTGLTADGDVLGESMAEVVTNTTSQLTNSDLAALIAYLRSLPPLPDEPK